MSGLVKSIRDTVTHLYFADWIWVRRWHGDSPTGKVAVELFPDVQVQEKNVLITFALPA